MRLAPIIILAAATTAAASGTPTLERGKELFESTALGSSGRSCASCHAGGAKLDGVSELSSMELTSTLNTCIEKALKGKALDPTSSDLKSLALYVRSIAPKH